MDLFDDFINHDYDSEEDDTLRLKLVIEELVRLSKLENEIIQFLNTNIDRFENNIKKLENWKSDSSDEDDVIESILNF